MKKKDKSLPVLSGIIIGIILLPVLGGVGYFGHKVALRVIDFVDIENRRPQADYAPLQKDFRIGFEKEEDEKYFDSQTAAHHVVQGYAQEGAHSLRVEFPSGREFPSLSLEVYGKDVFDWSGLEEFSFYAYNSIARPAPLEVKIRSGKDYPKKTYETKIVLPAQRIVRVKISRAELQRSLDLEVISGISLFMHDPPTSFVVYFDDFQIAEQSDGR